MHEDLVCSWFGLGDFVDEQGFGGTLLVLDIYLVISTSQLARPATCDLLIASILCKTVFLSVKKLGRATELTEGQLNKTQMSTFFYVVETRLRRVPSPEC